MTRERILTIFRELLLIAIVAGGIYGVTHVLATTGDISGVRLRAMVLVAALLVSSRHFFKSCRCYGINACILVLGIFSVLEVGDICHTEIIWDTALKELNVWLSTAILVIVITNWVNIRLYRGIMTLLLSGAWLMLCSIYPLYYTAEKSWFSKEAVLAIMQSNVGEGSSYLTNHITVAGVLLLILFLAILSLMIYLNVKYGGIKKLALRYKVALFIVSLGCMVNTVNMVNTTKEMPNESYILHSFLGARKQQIEYDKFKDMLANRNTMLHGLQANGDDTAGLYVLVIGESQTREHMSAYGYDVRETTPWLQEMMNLEKAIVFDNAYSCHTHTVQVLTYALTAKNQYNTKAVENSPSIIDVAKAAGYHTIWLSKQSHYGAYDTPISVIADSADKKLFMNEFENDNFSNNYDGTLVSQLENLSITGKTLLVIHLMGCHGGYADRYPQEAGVFAGGDTNTLYDNAVYYNDQVMKKLYERLSQRSDFQGMIYFADHGEEPVELGHNWGRFVPCMAEIPMYMIFSSQYKGNHKDRYETLQEHSREYFTNDLIYNTLLGIMGLKEAGSYEPENDISSKEYDGNLARFTTGYGAKHIEEIIK